MPIDQQFIEYIVKQIVDHPDEVSIERTVDEKGVLLKLSVEGEDLGRVIGKRGSTAQALRTMLRALGTKNDARYNLKIVDPDRPEPEPKAKAEDDQMDDESPVVAEESSMDEEPEVVEADEEAEDEEPEVATSSRVDAARKELAGLDDLDI